MGNLSNTLLGGGEAPLQIASALQSLFTPQPSDAALPPPGASPGFAGGHFGGVSTPPPMEAEADAVVKGFKPKKRSLLGLLGDMVLLHSNHKGPYFADRVKRKNFERAFEGFSQDPQETIRRIATFDPETAWKMSRQLEDDERQRANLDRSLGKDNDSRLKSISGLAGVALANPNNRIPAIRQYNSRLRGWDLEEYELPEDVSDAELQSIYLGVLPADKQERIKLQEERLRLDHRKADDLNNYRQERLEDFDNAEAGRNDRFQRGEAGKDRRTAVKAKSLGGTAYRDANGSLVEFNKDESNIKVTSPSGVVSMYKRGTDGRPVLIKRMTAEEYKKALEDASK